MTTLLAVSEMPIRREAEVGDSFIPAQASGVNWAGQLRELKMRPRAAEKLTKGVENRGVGYCFVAYPQLNVWLARFFDVVKTRLAAVLRHFCVRFAAN
jgi:hypothetical protein